MSIPTLDTDLSIIQKLDDYPNDVGGLSAADLKAKFDEAGLALQQYINEVLIPALIAGNLPFKTSTAIPAETVQAAIENVQSQLANVSAGSLPNNSVGMEKLSKTVQAAINSGGNAGTIVTDLVPKVNRIDASVEEATAAIANIQAVDASQSAAIAKNAQDIAGKADLSTSSSFTISKDGWTDKRQTITLAVGKRNAAVGLDSSATDEQCKESADCNVRLYSSNETSITLSCDTVPSLDLPGACILI